MSCCKKIVVKKLSVIKFAASWDHFKLKIIWNQQHVNIIPEQRLLATHHKSLTGCPHDTNNQAQLLHRVLSGKQRRPTDQFCHDAAHRPHIYRCPVTAPAHYHLWRTVPPSRDVVGDCHDTFGPVFVVHPGQAKIGDF